MATTWDVTIDCADPPRLAEFWILALGYQHEPPPPKYTSRAEWLTAMGIPEEEWDDGAWLVDPEGVGPRISLMKVPEPKAGKNRLHIDVRVGGGRGTPQEERWARITEAVARLVAVGATVSHQDDWQGQPHHMVMRDPEGNEFCLA